MTKKAYEPDQFDLLNGTPLPGGTIPKDLDRAEFWKSRGIPSEDVLTRLETEEKIKAMGWHATFGQGMDREGKPVVGRVMNPETAASESEWEQRNIQLHEQQAETHGAWMEENLPPKEPERAEGGNFTLRRSYGAPEPDPRIPKFENSPESAALRRAARRASDPSAQAERKLTR